MTNDRRSNLRKLATHLESLPNDYQNFTMTFFLLSEDDGDTTFALSEPIPTDCGTVACAIGHGPSAGIPTVGIETWFEYAERVFGVEYETSEWDYLFNNKWARDDDTPHGAAKRINTYLDSGIPASGWWRTLGSLYGPDHAQLSDTIKR